MKLFKPQVQLVRKKSKKKADKYFLHVITVFNNTSYRAVGHEPFAKKLNKKGAFEVRLLVKQDKNVPRFEYLTPVVHTLELGALPFVDESGKVAVTVYEEVEETSRSEKKKKKVGGAISSAVSADNGSQPL